MADQKTYGVIGKWIENDKWEWDLLSQELNYDDARKQADDLIANPNHEWGNTKHKEIVLSWDKIQEMIKEDEININI